MRRFKVLFLLILFGLVHPSLASPIHQDAVMDEGGDVITSKKGNCVRSYWRADKDICAPEQDKKPVPQVDFLQPDRDQRSVYFEFNKTDLTASSVQKLNALIEWIARVRGVTGAAIIGFADEIGSAEYNQALSEARARSVQSYLHAHGIKLPTRIELVSGKGESNSVTQCSTELSRRERISCLAADRRVEIRFDVVR